jgi:ABC-type Co2+ transport system permease subunit
MWAGYMPTHWKGVVYPVAIIAMVLTLYVLTDRYYPDLALIPALSGWAFLMLLCSRHSPSQH